jgi:hypothetical protein
MIAVTNPPNPSCALLQPHPPRPARRAPQHSAEWSTHSGVMSEHSGFVSAHSASRDSEGEVFRALRSVLRFPPARLPSPPFPAVLDSCYSTLSYLTLPYLPLRARTWTTRRSAACSRVRARSAAARSARRHSANSMCSTCSMRSLPEGPRPRRRTRGARPGGSCRCRRRRSRGRRGRGRRGRRRGCGSCATQCGRTR